MEEEKSTLESQITSLQQQKDQLEFLLKAHKPICGKDITDILHSKHDERCCGAPIEATHTTESVETQGTTIKREYFDEDDSSVCSTDSSCVPQPLNYSQITYTAKTSAVPVTTNASADRPNSLALGFKSFTTTGIPITTPSRGVFTLGLDSIADGHTGLTPLTGAAHSGLTPMTSLNHSGLTPAGLNTPGVGLIPCSTAHRISSDSSSEGLSSPTLLKL